MNIENIKWETERLMSIGDVKFIYSTESSVYQKVKSIPDKFLIVKSREMIQREIELIAGTNAQKIIDIGIWQGGSIVLYDLLFSPDLIVGIDFYIPNRKPLDLYAEKYNRTNHFVLHNYINQSDKIKLKEIYQQEFNDDFLDVIIDDASHYYEETKASFEMLFPLLAPGGIYIIEDWNWSFEKNYYDSGYFKNKKSLINILFQLIAISARFPDLISEVKISENMAVVVRGDSTCRSPINIDSLAINKGIPLELVN